MRDSCRSWERKQIALIAGSKMISFVLLQQRICFLGKVLFSPWNHPNTDDSVIALGWSFMMWPWGALHSMSVRNQACTPLGFLDFRMNEPQPADWIRHINGWRFTIIGSVTDAPGSMNRKSLCPESSECYLLFLKLRYVNCVQLYRVCRSNVLCTCLSSEGTRFESRPAYYLSWGLSPFYIVSPAKYGKLEIGHDWIEWTS